MKGKIIYIKDQNNKLLLEELMEEVLKTTQHPIDYYEIAALLESFGWNDRRASETFGSEDVFELAKIIWDMIQVRVNLNPFVEERKGTIVSNTLVIVKSFLRGVIFAMPMAISVLSMLTLRFSLWSYEQLDTRQATSIAIGTILSFMCVGGFTQAIARRGFFYINQGFYNMCKQVTFFIVRLGYICFLTIGLILIVINLIFRMLPIDMMILGVVYFLFLSANWLSVTVMYILKKEIVFTGLITCGIAIVWICFEKFKLFDGNIIYSQIIGLSFITISGSALVLYFFKVAEKTEESGISPPFPRISFMLYSLTPFFIYGLLYFTYLYCDRIIAWSLTDVNLPYIIWLRGEYELGLDFALLMLILPMGFSEVMVNKLMIDLENGQKNGFIDGYDKLDREYLDLYYKSIISVFISAIISAILTFFIVKYISNSTSYIIQSRFHLTSIVRFVFILGLISYTLLSVALMNAVILFSLSQPETVSKLITYSLIVNVITGFLFSRWGHHHYYAVCGLLIGTILFLISSCKSVIQVLKKLDYYIYQAM